MSCPLENKVAKLMHIPSHRTSRKTMRISRSSRNSPVTYPSKELGRVGVGSSVTLDLQQADQSWVYELGSFCLPGTQSDGGEPREVVDFDGAHV